jgi:hypothetical protein
MMQRLRHAARGLRRDPLLWSTATLTLALCIGANTTVFSLVNSILLRPLPFPDSDRIYWVSERMGKSQAEISLGADYYSLREAHRLFAEVGAFDPLTLNWSGREKPEQLDAAQVTPSFFSVLGAGPHVGALSGAGRGGARRAASSRGELPLLARPPGSRSPCGRYDVDAGRRGVHHRRRDAAGLRLP